MELEHEFTVAAPVERAWDVLLDLDTIVPCMPGAALTGQDGDTFDGTVKVKLGPVSMTFAGKGTFVERDEANRRVVVEAAGKDSRGGGTAKATVRATLTPSADPSSTDVHVHTDLAVTGRIAQFGRGMIADVSGRLLGQFTDCLQGKLAGGGGTVSARQTATSAGAAASTGGAATAGAAAANPPAGSAASGGGGVGSAASGGGGVGSGASGGAGVGSAASGGEVGSAASGGGVGSAASGGGGVGSGSGGAGSAERPENGRAEAFHGTRPAERAFPGQLEAEERSAFTAPEDRATFADSSEVEPVDLLAITGVNTAARRALPYALVFLAGIAVGAVLLRRRARN